MLRQYVHRAATAVIALSLSITLTQSLHAQGRSDYLNFETPQVKPICVADVDGKQYVLACNTPDSSIEIYDCVGNRIVDRIGVGLEPVSVKWNAQLSWAYTTNMLGDSVSAIELKRNDAGRLVATFVRTEYVGDEPMDIEFSADGAQAFVTLNSPSALAWLNAKTLAPIFTGSQLIRMTDSFDLSASTLAIKEPRQILRVGSRLWVLGAKGTPVNLPQTRINLWSVDLNTFAIQFHSNMGSAGLGMAATGSGKMYLASGDAQIQAIGETNVKNVPLGFVHSLVQRIDNPTSTTPTIERRNLNEDVVNGGPVGKPQALAHPSDLAIVENASGDADRVYVAAFHSDRIGVLRNTGGTSNTWTISYVNIPTAPNSTNKLSGPRGLAYKPANPAIQGDPGARVYVLNRLDNSIAVIDANTDQWLSTFALQHDPTPSYIREGRQFLYSAELSSNGFVSCASCHPDGRLDGMVWNLEGTVDVDPFPPFLLDGAIEPAAKTLLQTGLFPADKGFLATQSLQGLLNWEVDPSTVGYVTNQPYHWRGDRPNFEAFNGAFASLLGGSELSAENMIKFRDMVNSIHYPSNPEQMLNRRYSGALGDPSNEDDGSGALRGMKFYHTAKLGVCASRGCVHCHSLPEGSNNLVTEVFPDPFDDGPEDHPLETAALRGLLPKERSLILDSLVTGGVNPNIATPSAGLARTGGTASINSFNAVFAAPQNLGTVDKANLVNLFCREFDWGVGPLVGLPFSFTQATASSQATGVAFSSFATGAKEANSGFIVHAHLSTGRRGFAYDPIADNFVDVDSGAILSEATLRGLPATSSDVCVLMGTPLGSERRLAHPKGTPSAPTGPAPSQLALQPLRPNTAYRDVQLLRNNWDPNAVSPLVPFTWTAMFGPNDPVPEPRFLRTIRLYQHGLKQDGPSFGLTELRHDAPRRLRIAGHGIRPGALLVVRMPKFAPPYDNFEDAWPIAVPIYPTNEKLADGRPIWESAVEFEPLMYYGMMLGGPSAPGVVAGWDNTLPEPPLPASFDPNTWNKHHVTVLNADTTVGIGGWQALRL